MLSEREQGRFVHSVRAVKVQVESKKTERRGPHQLPTISPVCVWV